MQITEELITQFLKGETNGETSAAVAEYLQVHPEKLQGWLGEDWEQAGETSLAPGLRETMWVKISTVLPHKVKRMRFLPWAAAVLLFPVVGYVWKMSMSSKKITPVMAQVTSRAEQPAITWQQHCNHSNHQQKIQLPDGSVASLFTNSSIRYPSDYNVRTRPVYLDGQATFTVAKEAGKPFTVTAGKVVTIALGTVFNVSERAHNTTVQLYSGKVVIRPEDKTLQPWAKDIYLLPGQQLNYIPASETVAVSKIPDNINRDKPVIAKTIIVNEKGIVFDHAPLPEVMKQLMEQFKFRVSYNEQDIHHMYFSGTILKTDQPDIILRVIAHMNGLTITQTEDSYNVTKIQH